MNNSINLKQRTTNKLFSIAFSKKYKEWSKKTGGNQQDFADACGLQNKNSVSNWATGKQIPKDDTFEKILRVFNEAGMNVTVENFIPPAYDGVFIGDPSYIKDLQDENRRIAEEIGLSEDFLKFLYDKTSFRDLDREGYSVWSPLMIYDEPREFRTRNKALKHLKGHKIIRYIRSIHKIRAHDVTNDHSFTINSGSNTLRILSEVDLHILKEMQDQIVKMVEYLYFIHQKEMDDQVTEAILQANRLDKNGKLHSEPLSDDDLIAIDKYMKYVIDKNNLKEE